MDTSEITPVSSGSQQVIWSGVPQEGAKTQELAGLLTPRQQTLLSYWRNLLPEDEDTSLPRWADFDPLRVWTVITRLVVYEVLDEGNDLYFRLSGAEFERHAGRSLRGLRFSQISTPERLRAGQESARQLYEAPVPQLVHGWMEAAERDHVTYSRLSVPFALGPGGRLDIILACYEFGAHAPAGVSTGPTG